nr:small capsid protein [Equid gammaherpesvirus 5]UTK45596.1 small capsid protein [Equid gammaherpesvirus 5]UTK45675.1 small capsid protein [Equid gammaherpesvirus 5]UTK45754.1 small capsid protein [Equid gammaherpesvirus 5]
MPREDEEERLSSCSFEENEGYQPLKMPVVQGKLEDLDSNGFIAREAAALEKKNRSDEEFEKVKMLYVIFLKVSEIYDDHARVRLGLRRKPHMAGLASHGGKSFGGVASSVSSSGSGSSSGSSSTSFGSFQGLLTAAEPVDSAAAGGGGGGASGSSADAAQQKAKQQTQSAPKTRKQ